MTSVGLRRASNPKRRLAALAAASRLPTETIRERLFDSSLDNDAEVGRYASDELVGATRAALDETVDPEQLIQAWSTAFEPAADVLRLIAERPEWKVLFTNNGPLIDSASAHRCA